MARKSVPEMLAPMIGLNIEKYGRFLQGVFPTRENPAGASFIYSIGNHLKNMPELLIIGPFPPQFMAGVLNVLSDFQLNRGKPFEDGEEPDIGLVPMPKLRKCSANVRDEFTIQAGQYFKHENYDVMQVLIADPDGLFPDDPQCHRNYKVVMP
ncbi:DUF3309 domain-containing protein [Rhizobium phage RHph_Y1_11]|nr:DUF3309 domain-containing protein [Rhizobium phage RHph_Y1_11]